MFNIIIQQKGFDQQVDKNGVPIITSFIVKMWVMVENGILKKTKENQNKTGKV